MSSRGAAKKFMRAAHLQAQRLQKDRFFINTRVVIQMLDK